MTIQLERPTSSARPATAHPDSDLEAASWPRGQRYDLIRVGPVLRLLAQDGQLYQYDGLNPPAGVLPGAGTAVADGTDSAAACSGELVGRDLDVGPSPASPAGVQPDSTGPPVALAQPPRLRVAIVGGGALARACAVALAERGHRLWLSDTSQPDLVLHPRTHRTTGQDALADWLRHAERCQPDQVQVGEHWTEISQFGDQHAVVVAGAGAVADRAITAHLLRHGIPHLTAVQHGTRAMVSSVTDPGRTACQCCRDLALADEDPLWPHTVAALSRLSARIDPGLCSWAGQQVVQSLHLHFCGVDRSSQVEGFSDGRVRSSRWPLHPDCPCQLTGSLAPEPGRSSA